MRSSSRVAGVEMYPQKNSAAADGVRATEITAIDDRNVIASRYEINSEFAVINKKDDGKHGLQHLSPVEHDS